MLQVSLCPEDTDTFQHLYLGVGALGLSLIFHPNLNGFLPSDIGWAFALYLESVAVLCQLYMFMKEGRAQELLGHTIGSTPKSRHVSTRFTSHFLAAQVSGDGDFLSFCREALAKVMSFVFWASSFSELSVNPNHHIKARNVFVLQIQRYVYIDSNIKHHETSIQWSFHVISFLLLVFESF